MDRGALRATVHGVIKSRTRLSDFHFTSGSFQSLHEPHLWVRRLVLTEKQATSGTVDGDSLFKSLLDAV